MKVSATLSVSLKILFLMKVVPARILKNKIPSEWHFLGGVGGGGGGGAGRSTANQHFF